MITATIKPLFCLIQLDFLGLIQALPPFFRWAVKIIRVFNSGIYSNNAPQLDDVNCRSSTRSFLLPYLVRQRKPQVFV